MLSRFALLSVHALILFILSGCVAAGPTGSWQMSREAQRLFESGTPLENHNYYYTGPKVQPDAIIAIHKEFTLQSNLWIPIDITTAILDKWLFMYKTEYSFRCPYLGGYITTPDNRIAGVWYAKDNLNTIRFPEPGVIQVYQPFSAPGSMCDRERVIDDL